MKANKIRQNAGLVIMLLASLPIWVLDAVGSPDQPAYRVWLGLGIAATGAFLLLGGWLALHGEVPWSKRYWREKKDRESSWARREEANRVAGEAQRRTLDSLTRLCVEPVTFESGRVYWHGTAEKLREWLFIGALTGPEREEGERLVQDCGVLADNPHVQALQVKPPGPRATVDALRDIVGRHGGRDGS